MRASKIELAADVASCSKARHFVAEVLTHAANELRADASLLTSEVVTNAILHAGGPVTVEVQQEGGTFRIVVGDRSRTPPAEKGYRTDDATGRGVQLLDSLAAAWGWELNDTGKVVWFDLPLPMDGAFPLGQERSSHDDSFPDGMPIALLDAPVQEMIRTAAHYDALYREFRLILELESSMRQAVPGRLLHLIESLGTSFVGFGHSVEEEWDTALRENRERVDLHFRFPAEAGPAVAWYDRLLDEADAFCQRAELLTVAPTDEALAVRRWTFGQVARQCLGELPMPWSDGPTDT